MLAHRAPERFRGVHGGFEDKSFAGDQIEKVVEAGEYFFDWKIALMDAFGDVTTDKQLKERLPELSLKKLGLIGKPTSPMLLLNGALDSLIPVEDLMLLLRNGTAKDAWINPEGIHMGRETGVWDSAKIGAKW